MAFRSERPDQLPISASVWDVATRFDTGGPTVTEALYEAVKKLETEIVALRSQT